MRCDWNGLLSVLPGWMRQKVDSLGKERLQELRLRIHGRPELRCSDGTKWLGQISGKEDLAFIINAASRYSPWNSASTAKGFLTAPGGHRIGLCGDVVYSGGEMTGFREITSLCIRVARDFTGIARGAESCSGSVLILGPPGWGKTTLLRDLIRMRSDAGEHIAVVDERWELFPGEHFPKGKFTDVITGCPKTVGILTVLRAMGPDCIAVDEITAREDWEALAQAAGCGVRLLATAHASSAEDLHRRPLYRELLESGIFQKALILRQDKSWYMERMGA